MTASSWTSVGLLDDVAARYPWKFNLSKQLLAHLFVVELLHAKPWLLNDGYRVQNTYLQESILRREGLFWELLQAGFVSVMHRGHCLAEIWASLSSPVSLRVDVLRSALKIPQELADHARQVVDIIQRRKIPSTVELPPEIAASFSMHLNKFVSAT